MAEHTIEEMRDQALRAVRYFGAGLAKFEQDWIGVELDGTVFIAARGEWATKLAAVIEEEGLFGSGKQLERPTPKPVDAHPEVVLVPLYHVPPPEHQHHQGHVHLHVLADATLGRRERLSGECLCTKKRGSTERSPSEDEQTMCAECAKVAAENGIAWSR